MLPRILIACPTSADKNYCATEWMKNIQKFTYPNFDVAVFDNTPDGGKNAEYLQSIAEGLGFYNFSAFSIKSSPVMSVIERMCISHNCCREIAIEGGYSHLLHLESDVFPESHALQDLYIHDKDVVGALYYRDSGKSRRLMAQNRIFRSPKNIVTENFLPEDDVCFVDGKLKTIASIGLGCVLIKDTVLKSIPFRFDPLSSSHPDSFFSEDCFRNNISIFADTSLICEHQNESWGVHGFTWK